MAIARDIRSLPRRGGPQGERPDPEPRFIGVLVEDWAARQAAAGPKPTALGTRLRFSDAAKCSRAISYRALGIEGDPMDLAGVHNVTIGTMLHEAWQGALARRYGDKVQLEVPCKIDGVDASGSADALITLDDGTKVLYELKSIGGFGYKLAVGDRNPAEGPKFEHKVQAALYALALDADLVTIGYLAKETVSENLAAKAGLDELGRMAAEWTYTRDEWEPLALAEVDRLAGIAELAEKGTLAARKIPNPEMPAAAEITDPERGTWQIVRDGVVVEVGSRWECAYCPYQRLCALTPPGRVSASVVDEARNALAEAEAEQVPA